MGVKIAVSGKKWWAWHGYDHLLWIRGRLGWSLVKPRLVRACTATQAEDSSCAYTASSSCKGGSVFHMNHPCLSSSCNAIKWKHPAVRVEEFETRMHIYKAAAVLLMEKKMIRGSSARK